MIRSFRIDLYHVAVGWALTDSYISGNYDLPIQLRVMERDCVLGKVLRLKFVFNGMQEEA